MKLNKIVKVEKKEITLYEPLEPISGAKNIQHLAYKMNEARNQACSEYDSKEIEVDREKLATEIYNYLKDTEIGKLLNGRVDCIDLANTIADNLEIVLRVKE